MSDRQDKTAEWPLWVLVKQATGATVDDLEGNKLARGATARDVKETYWSYYRDVGNKKYVVAFDAALEVDKLNLKLGGRAHHLELGADFLGFTLVPKSAVEAASCDMTALCAISTESAEAIAAFSAARADHVTTAEEARFVREKIRDAKAAFAALDAHLARIERGET